MIYARPDGDRFGIVIITAHFLGFVDRICKIIFCPRKVVQIKCTYRESDHLRRDDLTVGHGGDQRIELSQFRLIAERQISHFHEPIAERRIVVIFVLVENPVSRKRERLGADLAHFFRRRFFGIRIGHLAAVGVHPCESVLIFG